MADEDLRMRVMELEDQLAAAQEEIDRLREDLEHPDRTRENEIYSLDRRAQLSETKNKEHSNALSLSAKKIINLEQSIKAYKFTAKDVAKCLGDCLHGGASLPVTKEELEEMYKAVSSASQTAADATLALRLSERVSSIFSVLDNELQQALVDVPPVLREKIRMIPNYEQALYEHKRGAAQVTADLQRLLSSVEEATLHFDMELQAVQPEGGNEAYDGDEDAGEYEDEFKPLTVQSFFKA